MKDEYLILQGNRNLTDGLWDIELPLQKIYKVPKPIKFQDSQRIPKHSLSEMIRKNETKKDLSLYLNATCFSPVHSTFIKSIKNIQFTTQPGLTSKLVTKHIFTSSTTTKGQIN